jgi:hypothetical protein
VEILAAVGIARIAGDRRESAVLRIGILRVEQIELADELSIVLGASARIEVRRRRALGRVVLTRIGAELTRIDLDRLPVAGDLTGDRRPGHQTEAADETQQDDHLSLFHRSLLTLPLI